MKLTVHVAEMQLQYKNLLEATTSETHSEMTDSNTSNLGANGANK